MRVSLTGLIQAIVSSLGANAGSRGDAFMLQELNRHIELVRDDPSRVHEFLDCWCRGGDGKTRLPRHPEFDPDTCDPR